MDDRKVHWDQNVTDPDDDVIDAEIVEDDEPEHFNAETGEVLMCNTDHGCYG